MRARHGQLAPREKPIYDSRIHGHEHYGDPRPGETVAECEARTRVWCAIGNAPDAMKNQMWRALNPTAKPPAAPASTTDALPTIFYHGGRGYSRDGHTPVVVSFAASYILGAFLAKPTAMTRADLETASRVTNAPQAIGRLRKSNHGLSGRPCRDPARSRTAATSFACGRLNDPLPSRYPPASNRVVTRLMS